MSNILGNVKQDLTINSMSQNLILQYRSDGSIWGKITPVRKYGDANPGIVYINGIKYTVTSTADFVKIIN